MPVKSFPVHHPRLCVWLAADLCAIAAYFLCRGNRVWMNALTRRVTGPIQAALGRLCSHTPVSVMEILTALAVLLAAAYGIGSAVCVIRAKGRRRERACTAILGALCAGLSAEALFCLTWGVNFWADSFQDRSGLYAEPVSAEDLRAVTAEFAMRVSEAADAVARKENGIFAVSREEILSAAPSAYDGIEQIYPFLAFDDTGVKAMAFSRLMSRMDFTGFYCSYTGEANVNMDSPACLLPATAAHEMAHQRGFASEQECNFLAVLACVTSGNPVYVYSGYLMGYIYLGNALWQADREAYLEIRETLPDTVRADLADNTAYWNQFQDTVARTVSNRVYDGILKSYGEERGIQSYGAMVDLLAAYYKPETP